jgi:peptidoglycan/xylan/chitin deacetylase (PgdA/CDA1 family)
MLAEEQPAAAESPTLLERVRYWKPASGAQGVLLTLEEQQLTAQAVPKRQNPKLLVVMYHNLVFGRTGNVYNRDIYNFEHDLAFLRRNFEIIGFEDLPDIANGTRTIDTDTAIITFDDGDLSMYAIAYPLLKEFDLKATFFLVPSFMGEVGYMSWEHAAEMASWRNRNGERLFSFGSHTMTHRSLSDLTELEILKELVLSKRIIEERIGFPVISLALPFGGGRGRAEVLEAARIAGYTIIRHSIPGALPMSAVDLLDVHALNVENYSTDRFVERVMTLTGR